MCGFVGFTGRLENRKQIVNKMMDRIIHRGPDMAGDYVGENITLGFRRLSIIDLSREGSQPMQNEDGSVVVVFNGEIYNFMALRGELEKLGHTFSSGTDTEVLIHGYEQYGEKLVEKLRGMFAFVIYDKKNDRLFGARDFFGIKPFYYARLRDGNLIFGSEIKTFLEHPDFVKKLNKKALRPYLTFQYSAQDETFFEGVYKLPPAHSFVCENGKMTLSRFWDVDFHADRSESLDDMAAELDRTVRESVEAHRISDVKVGAFLSGGVDSSYITACQMPDETFSVGFGYDKFDETAQAKELSDKLGIKNYQKILTADECFAAIPKIQYHMDEPQSNPSAVPLYFLAALAAEHVTVVLSGEGSDEIFAGYEWYDETPMMKKYKRLPQSLRLIAAAAAKRLPYFKGHDFIIRSTGRPEDYFIGQALVFPEKEATKILKPEYRVSPTVRDITAPIYKRVADKDEVSKKQYLDINLWMPGDILLKADKMSMAHSLELRVPFLDKKVMAMAEKIPNEYKINGINTKYILRKAANLTLPDEWANRHKLGFPVPIRYWLREEKYRDIVASYFHSDYAAEFFDVAALDRMLKEHYSGKKDLGRRIWTVFTFLVWYKIYFIDEEQKNVSKGTN